MFGDAANASEEIYVVMSFPGSLARRPSANVWLGVKPWPAKEQPWIATGLALLHSGVVITGSIANVIDSFLNVFPMSRLHYLKISTVKATLADISAI